METNAMGIDLDELDISQRKRVLVVEDELDTVFLLKQILRMAGFNVLSATSGREALLKAAEQEPDLVLLDLMMPEMDGWAILEHLRQMIDNVPVIIVSARGSKDDVVKGLQAGADDYVAKPFHNTELSERVKAVLRRASKPRELSRLVFPDIGMELDLNMQEVSINEKSMRLTPKEFDILSLLAKHAPAIVSYESIADNVWGQESPEIRRRIKYLIYLLRRKFESIEADPDLIMNIDRLGYKLQTEIT
jgi:DNA-binding response OmpR family regulator